MQWNRSNAIGLAKASCRVCHGHGIRRSERRERESPCNCIFRAIFRACYNRFREFEMASQTGSVCMETGPGPRGRQTFSRKREEFIADFCLVSRRLLNELEYRLFRYHFLLGADWRLCGRQLGMDRGTFFHMVYRIQQKLGRAFAELEPYALYPVAEYMHGDSPRRSGKQDALAAGAAGRTGETLRLSA
jgi:hypothetical protein